MWWLFACDKLIPPDPPVLTVTVDEDVREVPYAFTAANARQAADRANELSGSLGLSTWTLERWNLQWKRHKRFYRGACYLQSVELDLTLTGIRPVWTNVDEAPTRDQVWWHARVEQFDAHRDRSRQLSRETRDQLANDLRKLGPHESCDALLEAADALYQDALAARRAAKTPSEAAD